MDSAETLRLSSILSILGGSLELSIALPETFTPPIRPDAPILTLFGLIMIVCGAMLYSTTKLQVLWGATAIAMALLVIVVGSPVEGFEVLSPPIVLTGGILALLVWNSTSERKA